MPTRTYGLNEAVHVYYEIYNLTRNPFGRTNYRVSYSVIPRESGSPAGLIRRLARLGRGGREMVAVTSDRQGDSSFEREYVALNLGHARAGEVVLKVVVADLNAASGTERQATFVMAR